MYDRIPVAVDGSPTAERALGEATQPAQKSGSELAIAHVIDNSYLIYDVGYINVGTFTGALAKQGNQIVTDARAKVERAGVRVHSVVVNDPIGTFDIDIATEQATHNVSTQALMLSTHGCRGFQWLFLGGVTENIVRRSTLPVLFVRAEPTETSHVSTEPLGDAVIA